jgi:type I restriction enzyme S subunit
MFISADAHQVLKRSEVQSGDLLITITGNVGRVIHLVKTFGTANINQHIARIRVTSEAADAGFIYHQLRQPIFRRYFNSIVTGQAYPQISLRQVRDTMISLPALGEQQAIAAALSDIDADLAAVEAKREKAWGLKQGMMQELLTGRIRLI